MFDHQPTPDEVAAWFNGFELHDGLKHSQYVGGIVVIENSQWVDGTKVYTWTPYVNATARIAYFWDWVDNNDYLAFINVGDPEPTEIELPEGKSRHLVVQAEVTVEKEIPVNPDAEGMSKHGLRTIRQASGRKQVSPTKRLRNGTILPDSDALMKAETGAIARALGTIGMLSLPGSGLATAEDMYEYIGSKTADEKPEEKPKSKAAPNPKQ